MSTDQRMAPPDEAAPARTGTSGATSSAGSPGPPVGRLRYVRELDGIRGFGMLAVIAVHAHIPHFEGAFLAVDVFFVMSGFLIASLLIQERQANDTVSLRRFYLRRAARLVPALLIVLTACVVYGLAFPRSLQARQTLEAAGITMAHVANIVRAARLHDLGLLEQAWSLSIEEQFYLLVAPALVLLLALRMRLRALAWLFILLAVAATLHRARLWHLTGDFWRIYFGTDTHGDGLLVGVAAACLYRSGVVPRSAGARRGLQAASLLAVAGILVFGLRSDLSHPGFLLSGGYLLFAVLVAIVVYQLVTAPMAALSAVLGMRWIVFIGRISYGLYLWHLLVLRGFHHVDFEDDPVMAAVRILLAIGLASASYLLVEKRFLKLKKRFDVARPTGSAAPAEDPVSA